MTTPLDPTKMADWEIARAAEPDLKPFAQLAGELGLQDHEVQAYGRTYGKVKANDLCRRLSLRERSRYIVVTAINPTKHGEGKTTCTMGLVQGLAKLGKHVTGAIRQPSSGPTFNVKGSGAGGGLAQCLPLVPLSIRLTGDIDAVTSAHNLAMTALTARMQHEANYDDAHLAKRGLSRLNIDPGTVQQGWAIDYCAQALRHITIGGGGDKDGVAMPSHFQISVSSEVMAVLAVARDLADLRQRLGRIILAYDRAGRPVTTADLQVDGAMAAWLVEAVNPNLLQTLEGQPVFVHAGPFANIALGQSSVIADELGLRLADYHVTEAGFGADIGFEKFWNLKAPLAGLTPSGAVIVATVRALKHHGGAGKKADAAEQRAALEAGLTNLEAHIDIVKRSGLRPVVAINAFYTDSEEEWDLIRRCAEARGAYAAVSRHWQYGGDGARELAEAVVQATEDGGNFQPLNHPDTPLRERLDRLAREVYVADGVDYSPEAAERLAKLEADPETATLGLCMAKTQYSLSHDPKQLGRPTGWRLFVRDVLLYKGAGYIVPVAGNISLMPGTGSQPAYANIDVDTETGSVIGLH